MLTFLRVATVMVFADNPQESATWWADLLGADVHLHHDPRGAVYAWITVGAVELGFHPADERNPRGGSPVVYWQVDGDLDTARGYLLAAGCVHHRGPIEAEPGRRIAQIVDPFGTVVGIEGT